MLANLLSGLESIRSDSRVLERSPYRHVRRVRTEGETLVRMKLLYCVHLRGRACVSLKQDNPSRVAAVSQRTGPHLGHLRTTPGRLTGEDKIRGAWCRTAANLVTGLEGMPSNSRVLESSPYQHLRRVWYGRQTLFRMKLSPGVHLRSRPRVSL